MLAYFHNRKFKMKTMWEKLGRNILYHLTLDSLGNWVSGEDLHADLRLNPGDCYKKNWPKEILKCSAVTRKLSGASSWDGPEGHLMSGGQVFTDLFLSFTHIPY